MHSLADEFAAEVAQLCATTVTASQWQRFLDVQVPQVDATGQPLTGRALTLADTKRDTLALQPHGWRRALGGSSVFPAAHQRTSLCEMVRCAAL